MSKVDATRFRYEKKYLIDTETAQILKQRLFYVLSPDENGSNGQYHINSLYFDDIYNTSLYSKINGVSDRDKYRVRFYNGNTSKLRLERKFKRGEMVCKDRAVVGQEEYQMMCSGDYSFMSQESRPVYGLFYTAHLVRSMRPVVMVSYDRHAFMYPAGDVRITFDSGIMASNPMSGHSLLVTPESQIILEVKYSRFIPTIITDLLSGFQLTQQLALSKFTMSMQTLFGVYV